MRGTVVLSRGEVHRARVVERVTTGALTLKRASELLGISYRRAKRVKIRSSTASPGTRRPPREEAPEATRS